MSNPHPVGTETWHLGENPTEPHQLGLLEHPKNLSGCTKDSGKTTNIRNSCQARGGGAQEGDGTGVMIHGQRCHIRLLSKHLRPAAGARAKSRTASRALQQIWKSLQPLPVMDAVRQDWRARRSREEGG